MSPTKVLWISAGIIAFGTLGQSPQIVSFGMLVAILAATAEGVFYLIRR